MQIFDPVKGNRISQESVRIILSGTELKSVSKKEPDESVSQERGILRNRGIEPWLEGPAHES